MSAICRLAIMIDNFMNEYDLYEYGDCIDDTEQFIQQLTESIVTGDVQYMIDWFQEIIEEHDEYEQDAQSLIRELEKLQSSKTADILLFIN